MEQEKQGRQENQQRTPRVRIGGIVIPIVIYFAITIVVEFVLGIVLMQGVMMKYLNQSQEFLAMIAGFTETTPLNEMMDAMNGFLTDEVIREIMDLLMLRMGEFTTYTAIVSGILAIPIFLLLMRRDKKKCMSVIEGVTVIKVAKKVNTWKYMMIIVGAGCVCVALNNFINLMNLATYSEAYQETAKNLYSVPFGLQLMGLGIFVPIAEELLFRGILYRRIKTITSRNTAMLWSALLFAMFHGNLVQAIYGFVCGIILVWLYEVYGSIKAPILAHICMNIVSVVLTQYDMFYWMFEDPFRVGVVTVVSATLASVCYVLIKEWVIYDNEIVVKKE